MLFFPRTPLFWQLTIIVGTFVQIAPNFYTFLKIVWAKHFIRYSPKSSSDNSCQTH